MLPCACYSSFLPGGTDGSGRWDHDHPPRRWNNGSRPLSGKKAGRDTAAQRGAEWQKAIREICWMRWHGGVRYYRGGRQGIHGIIIHIIREREFFLPPKRSTPFKRMEDGCKCLACLGQRGMVWSRHTSLLMRVCVCSLPQPVPVPVPTHHPPPYRHVTRRLGCCWG